MLFESRLVRTLAELEAVKARFEAAGVLSFDLETTSLEDMTVWGFGMAIPPAAEGEHGLAVYIGCEADCEIEFHRDAKPFLERLFSDPTRVIVGHNFKFDIIALRKNFVENIPHTLFDTMVADWLLHNDEFQHGLDDVALRVLRMDVVKDLFAIRKLRDVDAEQYWNSMARYGTVDVIVPLKLREKFLPQLIDQEQTAAFRDLEMPFVNVLAEMNMAGVPVNQAHLQGLIPKLEGEAATAEKAVFDLVGYEFKLSSPVQLSEALFDGKDGKPPLLAVKPGMERGKPRGKKNPKPGAWPTGEAVLKSYDSPVSGAILTFRSKNKLLGTYVRPFLELAQADPRSRIYTDFKQTGTVTGRLSSSDPNMQNMPRDKGLIRRAIQASPGFKLITIDYSQIELRIMAHQSGDPVMLDAYAKNEDLHRRTAAMSLGIPEKDVTKEGRQLAKAINFGYLYGMSSESFKSYAWLNYGVRVSSEDAAAFREAYFRLYEGVLAYHDFMREFIWENGYAENVIGERRYLPKHRSSDNYERWQAWSFGTNHTVQGSAAALIKIAMRNIYRSLIRPHGYKVSTRYGRVLTTWGAPSLAHEVRSIMQVHDELVFEAREEIAVPFANWAKGKMETALTGMRVPIVAEIGMGPNLDEAK